MSFGEVERAINSLDCINNAICFYDNEKDKIVCAYAGTEDQGIIIEQLQKIIPKYMLPNIFVFKDVLTLNANGKIDRVKIKEEYYKTNARSSN